MKLENKMADTMIFMDLVHVDTITVNSLELGDLISYNDEIVEVIFIECDSTGDNYDIEIVNDFGEKEMIQFAYTDKVNIYFYLE
jgi:translation elongation factor P/translation initiation factor 5A